MSTGGSSSSRQPRRSPASGLSEAQINELVSKLQQLVPAERQTRLRSGQVSASKVLKETCEVIKNLRAEVDNLSGQLSELLDNTDPTQAAIIRALLDGNN